ncbi:MAG: xanthine dehydrogenase family protein molybdopterin-binding subunit [Desulfohalobiaceae bacterium]
MIQREERIVRGLTRFADDCGTPDAAHLVFVGSAMAHARIKGVDTRRAESVPGVLRVLTGEDVAANTNQLPAQADYSATRFTWRLAPVYAMAVERVRYHGEPVAAVVAEDESSAREAAALVDVEYEPLQAVTSSEQALEVEAPRLYEEWPDNTQAHLTFEMGDPDDGFARAEEVLRVTYREGRASGFPIEPRGCVARFDPARQTLSLEGSFQTPYLQRHNIAATLGLPESRVHVEAVDIGGAFGNKIHVHKEYTVALAAKLLGRSVKWAEGHREFIVSGPHQRDVAWDGEVAYSRDGRIHGVKARIVQDLGVESTNKGIATLSLFPACMAVPNMYALTGARIEGVGAVTNKSFYCAYRGYGKDKGIKFMEHAMDRVARKLGLTPEEIRRANYIPPEQMPFQQINNYLLDSGDYPAVLDKALEMADVEPWRRKRDEDRSSGRYLGVGVVSSVEPAGVAVPNSQMGGITQARVQMTADGSVTVYSDRTEIGQGAEKSHAIIVADILGCPRETVDVRPVDSEYIGQGPLSSRGAVYPASAVHKAASELRERIARCAGAFLEESPERIVLRDGCAFSADNPQNCLSFEDLGRKAYYFPGPRKLPQEMLQRHEHLLDVTATWYSPTTPETGTTYTTFCNSADVAVVEVDPEIGSTRILKYVHVHDAGTIIDKQIVDGQIHGGIVQGIGEALSEELRYDEQGRLLNTSLSEYLMPTTMESPDIEVEHLETPSPYTETGSKGMGEAPIIGSKAVILSAIEDALSPFGVEVNDSPATPERVLRWIRESGRTETT